MSDNRINIQFNVNKAQLKDLDKAASKLDRFNKRIEGVNKATAALSRTYGGNARAINGMSKGHNEMIKMVNRADDAIKSQAFRTNQMSDAQSKLQKKMKEYNRDARVNISSTGKMSARLKDASGNAQDLMMTWDDGAKKWVNSGKKMSMSVKNLDGSTKRARTSVNQLNAAQGKSSEQWQRTAKDMNRYRGELGMMAETQKGLNKYTLSFGKAMGIAALRMVQWSASATMVYGTARAFRAVTDTVIELDLRLTEMKQVMNESTNFDRIMENATLAANEFGMKITEVTDVIVEFGRQGYGEEAVDYLSRAASILSNVGQMDLSDAASGLTGVMNIYKKDFTEATQVVDRFNEVANQYAIDAENLIDSVRRSGGAANAFGVELETLIGYTTAITEATRESGSIVGNSLKTVLSRVTTVTGAVNELEAAGVTVFDPVTSQARPVQDVLGDLASRWSTLTDNQKQNIGVQVAGRHQLSRFLVLMDNYDTAMSSADTATKSHGSSVKENEKFMESFTAQIAQTIARFQELAYELGESGLGSAIVYITKELGVFASGMTDVVKNFTIWDAIIPTVAFSVAGLGRRFQTMNAMMKDTSIPIKEVEKNLGKVNPQIVSLGTQMGLSSRNATILSGTIGKVTNSIKMLASATIKNPLFWVTIAIGWVVNLRGEMRQLEEQQKAQNKQAQETAEEYKNLKESIKLGDVDEYGYNMLEEKIKATEKAQKMLNEANDEVILAFEQLTVKAAETGGNYDYAKETAKKYGLATGELSEKGLENIKIMDEADEELTELLGSIGIAINKNTTYGEAMREVEQIMEDQNITMEEAKEKMEEVKEDGILASTYAYEDMAEAIDDNAGAIERLTLAQEGQVAQLRENHNMYKILSQMQDRTADQTALMNALEADLAVSYGVTREEVRENIGAYDDEVLSLEELEEALQEATEGELSASEAKALARKLDANNTKKANKEKANSDNKYINEYEDVIDKYIERTGESRKEAEKHYEEIIKYQKEHNEEKGKSDAEYLRDYEEHIEKLMEKDNLSREEAEKQFNKKMKKSNEYKEVHSEMTKSNIRNLAGDTKANKENSKEVSSSLSSKRKKWVELSLGALSSMGKIQKTSSSTTKNTNKNLEKTDEKIGGVRGAWGSLKEKFQKPIAGTITMSIKGIFSGLFGKGGKIDSEKLRQKVEESAGGMTPSASFGKGFVKTSGFGMRKHPITGASKFHAGVDYGAPTGTPIPNQMAGRVIYSGFGVSGSGYGGYGNVVHVQGFNGLTYLYAHMNNRNVRAGQMVKKGQILGGVGSTGNSTGPHLHYEVRRGGIPINPGGFGGGTDAAPPKYHTGGIVGEKPNHKEIDTRLERGEMVMTKNQQGRLFKILNGELPPQHKEFGIGGGTDRYRVRRGDTISELAMKYYGNAYSGGIDKLLKLNPHIKNRHKIYVGQTIKVPSSTSSKSKRKSSSSSKSSAPKMTKKQAEKHWERRMDRFNYLQRNNLRDPGYFARHMTTAKDMRAVERLGLSAKRDFNTNLISSLSELSDVNQARRLFDKSNKFMSNLDQTRAWRNILKDVSQNVLDDMNDKTNKWLDNFNSKMKEANWQVDELLRSYESMLNRVREEAKDDFTSKYIKELYDDLDIFFGEELTLADELEEELNKIEAKIRARAEESALLEYQIQSGEGHKRLKELKKYMQQVEKRMDKVNKDMRKKGVRDSKIIKEAQEPLREQLKALEEEYNYLNKALRESEKQVKTNKKEMDELVKKYKELEDQLESVTSRREFTDEFGNVVRDAENRVKYIQANADIIIDSYTEIAKAMREVHEAESGITVTPKNDELKSTDDTDESVPRSDMKTFQADTNVIRDVTYIVQTGVSIASESELREFAMLLKEMMDEEDGRGND